MRLVTRCDLDGLACAVLIGLHEEIDEARIVYLTGDSQERAEAFHETRLRLIRFLHERAAIGRDWEMSSVIDEQVAAIRAQVGDKRAICGLSGGVDSITSSSNGSGVSSTVSSVVDG